MKSTIICKQNNGWISVMSSFFLCAFFLLAVKVAYSLPVASDFNITLSEEDGDPTQPDYQVKTVVLDAGHGGKDPGCVGKKTTEKEVALDVVLKVGQMIKNTYPDVKVIYTRDSDEFIPLYERASIANRNQADLFISVHCNGVEKRSVSGSETFVLGLHRVAHNLEVAKRENAAILKEENYKENYDGFDPNSDESHIALSMYQSAFLDQSIALATLIEGEFVDHAGRTSRGVKQAGFVVLKNTTMPSVLVEAGFLSNAKEESFLMTEDGKKRTATSIFNAFSKYKYDIESYALEQPRESSPVSVTDKAEVSKPVANHDVVVSKPEASESHVSSKPTVKPTQVEKPVPLKSTAQSENTAQQVANTPVVQKSSTSAVVHSRPATTSQATNEYRAQANAQNNISKPVQSAVVPIEKVEYVVQIAAGAHKLKPVGSKWRQLEDVLIRYENGMYKYQVGGMDNFTAASQKKIYLKQLGFSDCFIAAYKDGKPVKLTDVAMAGAR